MNSIKAIFFDLDDTLVDSRKAEMIATCAFKEQFKEFKKIGNEDFEKLWHEIAIEQYKRYERKEISYEQHRIERIKSVFAKFNIEKEDEEALKIFNIYLEKYAENWTLFHDAKEVLDYLKNKYKLGIITNGDGTQQRNKIVKTRIIDYFSEIIISGDEEISKPNKKIFEIACNKINEDSHNCLMVGDNYENDIKGAIDAGLNAIWLNRGNKDIEYKSQIKELTEIFSLDLLYKRN